MDIKQQWKLSLKLGAIIGCFFLAVGFLGMWNDTGNIGDLFLFSLFLIVGIGLLLYLLETFIVPCQNVQSFTFVIEGCNVVKIPD